MSSDAAANHRAEVHAASDIERIASRAVHKAQEESRRLGVPNVYCINGIIYHELPSGELTTTDPYQEEKT